MEIFVVGEEICGGGVLFESERRWRKSIALLRSVVMSRLIVLGQSLLRCLWVGRVYGAVV